ncbi:MAG: hypothetical protein JSW60_00585 [Thermoplasmatales archaeon]|nr:MAG: hypothetical protein JSW60_00585 [Thermoplasmatales archaeon]
MQHNLPTKGIAVAVIVLFIGMSVPSTGNMVFFDDITPPVTTISFDPPHPDGDNGWYVNNVTVTLNATDDVSGVKAIYYKIPGDEWRNHTGDFLIFILDYDCLQDGLIEFYSVDYAGNQEETKSVLINIDQLPPEIELEWEVWREGCKWWVRFTNIAEDACSGMDRVESFIADTEYEIVTGGGPTYTFEILMSKALKHITFSFYCYDEAGNVAIESVNGSEIKSYPNSQSSSTQQSSNVWFLRFLERFSLSKRLLKHPIFNRLFCVNT